MTVGCYGGEFGFDTHQNQTREVPYKSSGTISLQQPGIGHEQVGRVVRTIGGEHVVMSVGCYGGDFGFDTHHNQA